MDRTAQIKDAIATGDVDHARALLRDALRDAPNEAPTAELYVLAAQVALDDDQRRRLLDKALALDPFNAEAVKALERLQTTAPVAATPATAMLATTAAIPDPGTSPPAAATKGKGLPAWVWLALVAIPIALVVASLIDQDNKRRAAVMAELSRPRPTPTPEITVRTYTVEVSHRTPTSILVRPGDQVEVSASGRIRVSPLYPAVGPNGSETDIMEFFLSGFSVDEDFRHGALLYSVTEASAWYLCGSACSFSIRPDASADYLEFEINDDDQGNNSGAFTLTVTVTGRG